MALDGTNFNLIKGSYNFGKKDVNKDEKKAEEKEDKAPQQPERKDVDPDKILSFLGANAIMVNPKAVDPSKYVDSASEARIEEMMARFEKEVESRADIIKEEFPQVSAAAIQTLALKEVEKMI